MRISDWSSDVCSADLSSNWKKRGRILKVILFGSYARGAWVDEPHTTKGYRSDFDQLIIVNNHKLGEYEPYWHKAVDRFLPDREIRTPVRFLVHSRREVNEAIRKGQYFFTAIRSHEHESELQSLMCISYAVSF